MKLQGTSRPPLYSLMECTINLWNIAKDYSELFGSKEAWWRRNNWRFRGYAARISHGEEIKFSVVNCLLILRRLCCFSYDDLPSFKARMEYPKLCQSMISLVFPMMKKRNLLMLVYRWRILNEHPFCGDEKRSTLKSAREPSAAPQARRAACRKCCDGHDPYPWQHVPGKGGNNIEARLGLRGPPFWPPLPHCN